MYFRVGEFVSNTKVVAMYTFEVCGIDGNVISRPTSDFLNTLYTQAPLDAQILKSQILDAANKYGLSGRMESSRGREGLFAMPSKYDEDGKKITSRYRLYYWVLNGTTVLLGGGCYKPETIDGQKVTAYQKVPECEDAANELSAVSNHLESLKKKGEIFIEERLIDMEFDEILKI